MPKSLYCLFTLLLCAALAGCNKNSTQSASMLAFEQKQQEVQVLADKAIQMLDDKVRANPEQHLQQIALAYDYIQQADNLFKKANIIGIKNQDIEQLRQELKIFDEPLMQLSISHMYTLIDKTLAIRKRVEQIRSQPYSMHQEQDIDPDVFIQRLSADYNKDIEACCLNDIIRIKNIIRDASSPIAPQLVQISQTLPQTLHNIIKDEQVARDFSAQLAQLQQQLKSS